MNRFGLIGYPLGHSFSEGYFADKFEREGIGDCRYDNYPIKDLDALPDLFANVQGLRGLNVTIPHKKGVIQYLDALAEDAAEVAAVNTIKFYPDGTRKGFNSDIYGFGESLRRLLPDNFVGRGLILGTGGSSGAVAYVLRKMGVPFSFVSRNKREDVLEYKELSAEMIATHHLIINTTPLGMHPDVESCPGIPYHFVTSEHYLVDLIYNPDITTFLRKGMDAGASVKNGFEMLELQAEKSWEIWNDETY